MFSVTRAELDMRYVFTYKTVYLATLSVDQISTMAGLSMTWKAIFAWKNYDHSVRTANLQAEKS
jgi:hypothetical protein